MHVTLRSTFRPLRSRFVFSTLCGAIADGNARAPGHFRIVHFSVQVDHLHLLVEAADARALSAGLRGMAISIARRVNALVSRRGRFWADRWHGRALESPHAVRAALVYVLGNFRKHGGSSSPLIDLYSSAPDFAGFRELAGYTARELEQVVGVGKEHVRRGEGAAFALPRAIAPSPGTAARTWLLRKGWRRHGFLSMREAPRASPQRLHIPAERP